MNVGSGLRIALSCILFLIVIVGTPTVLLAQELQLFGGLQQDTYLGCLTCSRFSTRSIWNRYGQYGSRYSYRSIWNRYSQYGSPYSSMSPWNTFASNAPIIVDDDGAYYGVFTVRRTDPERTRVGFLVWLLDNWEWVVENVDQLRDEF